MNFLVGIVIVICLLVSEANTGNAVDDFWTRIFALVLVTFLVPAIAAVQTVIVSRRRNEDDPSGYQSSLQRMAICHNIVWLAASLFIVWSIQWQDVVRGNWNLDRWPLIDEFVVLLPMLLSLLASWAVFYELQRAANVPGARVSVWNRLIESERIRFVTTRFRIYIALFAIPLGIGILLKDLGVGSSGGTVFHLVGVGGLLLGLIIGFPFLLSLVWRFKRLEDEELRQSLKSYCKNQRLNVYDVRVWSTGGKILNAFVVGVFPGTRMIVVSDALLKNFEPREIKAIIRHEAGHIRLWHLPIRICYAILPLILAMGAEATGGAAETLGVSESQFWIATGALYTAYLGLILPWVSRKMEYEADEFATFSESGSEYDQKNGLAMMEALFKFASFVPGLLDRKGFMHPSLRNRIQRIIVMQKASGSPARTGCKETGLSVSQQHLCFVATLMALAMVVSLTFW